jgi:hypothetical protein
MQTAIIAGDMIPPFSAADGRHSERYVLRVFFGKKMAYRFAGDNTPKRFFQCKLVP